MDSWAVVTGAGSGIGRGIVLALAKDRSRIALVGRRRELLERTAEEARQLGATCLVIVADLSKSEGVQDVIDQFRTTCGTVGTLINNAGLLSAGALSEHSLDQIEGTAQVNLVAPMLLTRACWSELVANQGAIVLVASTAAWVPFPYASLYAGTKAGLRVWGESLRAEARTQNVHVMLAYPPFTETAMTEGMSISAGVQLRFACPLKVGQQIVNALQARRAEWWGAWTDRWLARLERFVPSLMHRLMYQQRNRLQRMMDSAQ